MASINGDARFTGFAAGAVRPVYIQTDDGKLHKAYETTVEGMRGRDPARDKVYVDMDTGEIVADYPQIYFAESRKVYSANGGTYAPRHAEAQRGSGRDVRHRRQRGVRRHRQHLGRVPRALQPRLV